MSWRKGLFSLLFAATAMFVVTVAAMLAGCSSQAGPDKSKDASAEAVPNPSSKAAETADAQATSAEGLAELGPEDRVAAEKQRVCPVTGERLGAMGKPYKITVKGQTVFLCCSGCEEEIRKEPDKYLAKLQVNPEK
jgi:YHS domain-containing protein